MSSAAGDLMQGAVVIDGVGVYIAVVAVVAVAAVIVAVVVVVHVVRRKPCLCSSYCVFCCCLFDARCCCH